MKVQVKEGKKLKEFDLINSWTDVNLETWMKLAGFEVKQKANKHR
mgnify:CR=1 FL=1